MIDFARYRALSFDCYGTLIDWDEGLGSMLGPLLGRGSDVDVTDALLGRFADAQYRQQRLRPVRSYPEVVAAAVVEVASELGAVIAPDDVEAVVASIGSWPPFPDTRAVLRAFHERGLVLGVVSNVDEASFARSHEQLGGLLDVVVTAEAVGAYKPDRQMFEALCAAFAERGIAPGEILHVAQSRFHDIGPAASLGLDAVWVDRRAGRPGRGVTMPSEAEPQLRVTSLAELVERFEGST